MFYPFTRVMDGMVEESGANNGTDPLSTPISVQSVIQANQQSVIQSAQGNLLTKGNVILVSKPNSVIQTPQGQLQTLQVVVEAGSDDESLSNEEDSNTKKRRDILSRRPSYRKILSDLGGTKVESSGSDCDSNLDSELSSHSLPTHYQTVIPAGTLQLSQGEGIHTLTMTNSTTAGGTIVQYTQGQDGEFYVPGEIVVTQNASLGGGNILGEDQARKREMRLLKNREAARECRRKKKEYIKCLENRVAVLENQNKALIEELKTLKELYCQTKTLPNIAIDMFEKLPVPYGLVRYGVAPDHPEVKNVVNTFSKTASNKNFNFHGNVTLGKDVQFKDIRQAYHAVILSYGCSEEKQLGIKGENQMISARRLVGWYNGLPEDKNLSVDLNSEVCTIVGQGNVAIDVARILLTPIDILKTTDITSYSLEALSQSKVKKVNLVGRRGPLHVAFTIKEFREMTKLPNVQTILESSELASLSDCLPNLDRPRKRLTELLIKTASTDQCGKKLFCPLFFRKPHECSTNGIVFRRTVVKDNLKGIVEETKDLEELICGLMVSSVGYQGVSLDPDIPFDKTRGIVLPEPGVYASGWISTGPVGVILSTMNNAFQQAAAIVSDIQSGKLNVNIAKPGFDYIQQILLKKGVTTVTFEGWRKIDKVEVENGEKIGKPREKIVDIEKMLEIGGN